ncbi:MAG: hypothetical protein J5693_01325 [Bacteroidales bacterium]|nr:hypothetical protein [Bacteroidales bacterium]
MRRNFKIIAFVFAIALSLASCKPLHEQISINDYSLDNLGSISVGLTQLSVGADLNVDADNASCYDIVLKKLYAQIYSKNGKLFATVTLDAKKDIGKPTLKRRSSQLVDIPLQIEFESPLSALALADLDAFVKRGYTVNYDCTLKAGIFQKRFKEEDVPLEQLVKMLEK